MLYEMEALKASMMQLYFHGTVLMSRKVGRTRLNDIENGLNITNVCMKGQPMYKGCKAFTDFCFFGPL